MIYDCVFYLPDHSFLCALPHGHVWSTRERVAPFLILESPELTESEVDSDIRFVVDGIDVFVKLSEIDSGLVVENG